MDPYFAKVVALMTRAELQLPVDAEAVARLVASAEPPPGFALPDVKTGDTTADGPHGPVPLRIYTPSGDGTDRPMLVWCHGGGWVGGDLDMPEADATAREVCERAGAVVVSADYRLAIDGVHFPVPHDDVVAAFVWATQNATALGADAQRISFGGASAGANLVAGAVLRLRDEGGPLPRGVLLAYPLVHPVLPDLHDELVEKVRPLSPALAFAPEVLEPVVENYLGGPVPCATPYAFAALGRLHDHPPTLVINAEHDGLRASGEAYADALRGAGSQVEVQLARGVVHGHLNHPWLPQAQESYAAIADWVGSPR